MNKSRPNPESSPEKRTLYDFYVASVPVLRSLSWPLLIALLILGFIRPIRSTLDILPDLLARSSNITVGEVRLEIQNRILTEASPQVREALLGMSTDAFVRLIRDGTEEQYAQWTGFYCETTKEELLGVYSGLADLESRGLAAVEQRGHPECPQEWFWSWTDLGKESYAFVLDSLIEEFARAWQEPD